MEVTIGLSVYNDEEFIEDCINSILNQTHSNFKLIIVDDGSTDNSLNIIRGFNDSRIELYVDGENKGLPVRLNQIAKLTRTDYLARMDADDIMHIKRLETQLNILKNNQEIDVLGCNSYSLTRPKTIVGTQEELETSTVSTELKRRVRLIHPTVMAKTEWFLKNPYEEKLRRAQDLELWIRVAETSKLMSISTPLLFRYKVGGSHYKKYFKAVPTKVYIAKKYKKSKYYIGIFSHILKGSIYYIFNIFNMEEKLIKDRYFELTSTQMKKANEELKKAIAKN